MSDLDSIEKQLDELRMLIKRRERYRIAVRILAGYGICAFVWDLINLFAN